MVQYFFNKYEIEQDCTPYGEYREDEWELVSPTTYVEAPLMYTHNEYRFDSYDGSFYIPGSNWETYWVGADTNAGRYHWIRNGELYREVYEFMRPNRVAVTGFVRKVKYVETGETCRDVRGRYVGTVKGDIGDYPSNGIRGGYWYIRSGRDESPSVIFPNNGDTVSHLTTVKWDTSVRYGSGTEGIWLEISSDNGKTWDNLFRMVGSVYERGEMEFDFNKFGNTSQAKLRMFAVVDGKMTTPNETQGNFTIISNVRPNTPQIDKEGIPEFYAGDDRIPLHWTFDDDDIPDGDYQSGATIVVREKGFDTILLNVEHKGEKTSANIPVGSLRADKQYGVSVITKDRLNMESPESLPFTFWKLKEKPNVQWLSNSILTTSKVKIDFETNFNYGRSDVKLYDSEGKLLETSRVMPEDTDVIFKKELENLKAYTIVLEAQMLDDKYGGGYVGDFVFRFTVMLEAPPTPSLTYTATSEGIELIPKPNDVAGKPKTVRMGLQKYVNGAWITLTEDFPGYYLDRFAVSGETLYRSIAYSDKGSFSFSDPVPIKFKLDNPVLTNLRTLETIHLEDIIKTDLSYKPDTEYHRVISRDSLIAETGGYVERTLKLEWEIYTVEHLNKYKDFLWYDDLYLYRDGEGRYLRISIRDISEREEYNPHWFYLSLDAIEVSED